MTKGVSLIFCLLLGCTVQPQYEDFCLVLLYPVFLVWLWTLTGLLFSVEKTDGKLFWGRGKVGKFGGTEGRKTVVGMYCMREKNLFLIKIHLKDK